MFSTPEEELFFFQKVLIKKKYTNVEIIYLKFFYDLTNIFPENIIILKKYIFFFVKNKVYFKAKRFLRSLRAKLSEKKVVIIRAEKILIKVLLSFFPDPYIHDMKLETNKETGVKVITAFLISYKERGIAIGRSGDYIKAVNEIFRNYVRFENIATFEKYRVPLEVKCRLIDLNSHITKEHPLDQ